MKESKIIAIGSDHAGFEAKQTVKSVLEKNGYKWKDFGTHEKESCDYPDYARTVAKAVSRGDFEKGILCCGSGIGVSMVANKVRGARAALCHNAETAKLSREHNNSNILCFGERTTEPELVPAIIEAWLNTEFEGGRHARRVDKFESPREGEASPWSSMLLKEAQN